MPTESVNPGNDNKSKDKQIDSTDNQDSNCLDKSDTVQISCPDKNVNPGNQTLVEQFEVGQIVKLKLSNFEGADEELKLANHK